MAYTEKDYTLSNNGLAGVHGMRSPVHRTVDPAFITADSLGSKVIPPFTYFMDLGSGYCRPLPRTLLTADVGTGTAILPVKDAYQFIAGGVLIVPGFYAKVTIASSTTGWAAADTITVTLNGVAIVYTVVAEDIGGTLAATNTNIATKIAALINTRFKRKVTAYASGGVIALVGGFGYSLTAADTGTNGTATASAANLAAGTAVGTILSVNPDAKTITLTANNATAITAGMPIGISGSSAIGISAEEIDPVNDAAEQGLYTSLSVRREVVPYYDAEVEAALPEIQLV